MSKKYILDTNVLIDIKRGTKGVREHVLKANPENCFISAVSIAELETGYILSKNEEELQNLNFCKEHYKIIPASEDILGVFSKIKADQILKGKKVPDFDLVIAATAKLMNCTVVTHDEKHFSLIDNLQRTDWIEP